MKKRKVLLDCDPGHDDAIAIMLAGKNELIDLIGITVVSGNQTLEKTGRNALNLCQYLDIDVPVCLGADNPIIKDVEICEAIHGESGLDGFTFPKLTKTYDERRGVDFIVDTLLNAEEPIDVVTTGPMTNLALALRVEPRIKKNIRQVTLMGGSYQFGNVTPAAEFNILVDPEAAHIVFNSGLRINMIGLDVTHMVKVLPSVVKRMEAIHNKASKLFTKLMKVYNENQYKVFELEGGPLHDPVTIAYLLDEDLLEMKHVNCEIDLSKGSSYGRTNCDIFNYLGKPKNTYVAVDIDVEKFWDIVEDAIKKYD